MPSYDDQRVAALGELRLYSQPDVPPTLDSTQLDSILDSTARAAIWTASQTYEVGSVILPTVRNGRRYRVAEGGTSGATEPSWSTANGARISDGDDLVFVEDGPDFRNVFNVRAAIHKAWIVKASKASALFASGNAQMQQAYEQCLKQAQAFAPVEVA